MRAILLDAVDTLIHATPTMTAMVHAAATLHEKFPDAAQIDAGVRAHGRRVGWPDDEPLAARRHMQWSRFYRGGLRAAGLPTNVAALVAEEGAARVFDPAGWDVFPEVRVELTRLRQAGHPIALISNFDTPLRAILQGQGLLPFFDAVAISSELGVRKPQSAIFRWALDALGVQASDAIMVGDSVFSDVEGANAAGIAALLLDRRRTRSSGSIASLRELLP